MNLEKRLLHIRSSIVMLQLEMNEESYFEELDSVISTASSTGFDSADACRSSH